MAISLHTILHGDRGGNQMLVRSSVAGRVGLLLLTWIAAWSEGLAQERPSPAFQASAASLLPGFFRVKASFSTCSEKYGFALLVGEDDGSIYLAVPDHVVHCEQSTLPIADLIELQAYAGDHSAWFVGEFDGPSVSFPSADAVADEDVSFLVVSKPDTWQARSGLMADTETVTAGLRVTLLGYTQKPIIPPVLGIVLDGCDHTFTTSACSVLIESLVTEEGTSGGVIFNEGGGTIGLSVAGAATDESYALRMDEIRRIAENYGVPWTAFTDAEEQQIGEMLGRSIEAGNNEEFQALLGKRINLDRPYEFNDENGPYPLLAVAGWAKQLDMAVKLINAGARAHYGPAIHAAMEMQRYDVLQVMVDVGMGTACPLTSALHNNDKTSIDLIIGADSPDLISGNCEGITPLNAAVRAGNQTVANLLLDKGASQQAGTGSPLVSAILERQLELVDRLFEAGPNLGLDSGYRGDGTAASPLHAAAYVGDGELVRRLVEMGVPVDLRSDDGFLFGLTPFEAAVFGGNFEVAKILVDYGASPLGYRSGRERIVSDLILYPLTDVQKALAEDLVVSLATRYCQTLAEAAFEDVGDFRVQRRNCEDL